MNNKQKLVSGFAVVGLLAGGIATTAVALAQSDSSTSAKCVPNESLSATWQGRERATLDALSHLVSKDLEFNAAHQIEGGRDFMDVTISTRDGFVDADTISEVHKLAVQTLCGVNLTVRTKTGKGLVSDWWGDYEG
jgi:hypothetical protein